MPPLCALKNNFTAGVVSKLVEARVDLDRYNNAAEELVNYIILNQGPIQRPSGTRFVVSTKDSTKRSRLVKFEFSLTQAYMLEFGHNYIRYFKDEAIITQTAQNISGITKANPAVVTYVGADTYANGDRVIIAGVVGMTEVNNREFTVANVNTGANTFELSGVDSTGYTTYSSGGTVAEIVETTTTYTESMLRSLVFTQSADVLYIASDGTVKPKTLTRSSHTVWTFADYAFEGGPFLSENTTSTDVHTSAATGSVTITANAAIFASTDVNRWFYINAADTNFALLKITAFTDSTHVTATVMLNKGNNYVANSYTTWRFGAWSDTTSYPTSVSFHENRLWWAGSVTQPQTLWGTRSNDFVDFMFHDADMVLTDDSGVNFTIGSNEVNNILWLDSGPTLILGTPSAEFEAKAASITDPITPTNIRIVRRTTEGCKAVRPHRVGSSLLFVQRSGRMVVEHTYSFDIDNFEARDLTILSENLFNGKTIVETAYQKLPYSVLWVVTDDGKLYGMTYVKKENIAGWHVQEVGGTGVSVESIEVMPTSDATEEQLWCTVKRTINGATARYIEFFENPYTPAIAQEDAFFVSCGLTYDSTPTTTISSLNHLIGETVWVVGDGIQQTNQVVSSAGKITITSASVVHVGLAYTSRIRILPPEGGNPTGTSQAKIKRTHKLAVRVKDSLGLKISEDGTTFDALEFTSSTVFFTGDVLHELKGDYVTHGQYSLKQDAAYPSTILGVFPKLFHHETV